MDHTNWHMGTLHVVLPVVADETRETYHQYSALGNRSQHSIDNL